MEVVESETTCIVLLCCGQGEQLRMAAHARLAVCRLKQYLLAWIIYQHFT